MKRLGQYLYFSFVVFLLGILGMGIFLFTAAARLHPAIAGLWGLLLVSSFLFASFLGIILILPLLGQEQFLRRGSRKHKRYCRRLANRYRRHPVTALENLPAENDAMVTTIYQQAYMESEKLTISTAETVFFHTAISQSGYMDSLVLFRTQLRLIRQLTQLYYPKPGMRVLLPAYISLASATLWPSSRTEVNLGAQIGPAIVGASVVGAIPGANLVSVIIADAVIKGSANALTTLRIGLLARQYYQSRFQGTPFQPRIEFSSVNQEALSMLSTLVSGASGVLSKEIWDAAKENLRRMPAATYDSLKSLIAKSVQGLGRKKEIDL